jgi:uncharacterized protein (TIGR03435 family)
MKSDNKNGRNTEARLYSLLRLPPLGAEGVDSDRVLDRVRDALDSQTTSHRHVDEPTHARQTPWRVAVVCVAIAAALVVAISPALWKPADVDAVNAVKAIASSTTKTLADGSRIEMRSGAEAVVENMPDGLMIHLNSGSMMVFAAKQAAGRHLYVQTRDLKVSVVGTVFLVKADDNGSRVAVIEGEVRVQQGAVEKSLRPGEQLASNPRSENLKFFLETGWSREAFAYLSKLHESMAQSLAARQSAGRTTSISDKQQFEEASIRVCEQDIPGMPTRGISTGPGGSGSIRLSPNRVEALCLNAATLIRVAHRFLKNNPAPQNDRLFGWRINSTFAPTPEEGIYVKGGPGWVRSEKYTIAAIGDSTDARTLRGPMLLDLLERRFNLKLRIETEEIPVYALTIAQGGLKIKPKELTNLEEIVRISAGLDNTVRRNGAGLVSPDLDVETTLSGLLGCSVSRQSTGADWPEINQFREAVRRGLQAPPCGTDIRPNGPNEVIAFGSRSLGQLVEILSSRDSLQDTLNGLVVVDKTGLPDTDCLIGTGTAAFPKPAVPSAGTLCAPVFNLVLEYAMDESFLTRRGLTPDQLNLPKAPNIFKALEKLGLQLEKSKAPREFIVIEHIDRPSPN